ncbi:TolC family protein [Ramlibacter alkalitolerans]|uniref:TolC family protein n=1 Tax=Ramlibacter alkalitolerans TaxID=2039631 RepID=A0ABS1JJ60_9BURK|nr:TolC family protein [Ramlibacter alkalitolerans]MBL0424262.1 TolC family protein [Ramlibacter alkalitolerans]
MPSPCSPAWLRASTLAILLTASAWAAAQPAALGADLPTLLDYARQHNPELAAMQHEAQAAAQRVQPAGALPDPVLRVELMNVNNFGNEAGFNLLPSRVGETKYTLMQMIPWSGKRGLKREAAAADALQAQARASATWAEQVMKLRTAFAQYYLAAQNERITGELLELVTRLEQVAQTRYAGGLAPQQDAIRAQLEQTTIRGELIAAADEKRQQQARLNALLGRQPGAALAQPRELPSVAAAALDPQRLTERMHAGNAVLRTEAARLQAAQANRALALRNRYPDVNVGVSPSQMGSRITTWGLMVEVNIPLQQSVRRAQEGEAAAMVEAARARTEAAANQAAADLEEQLSGLDAARRNEVLIATRQLPQSELVLQSAVAAYENGKVDFATLLEAQRQTRKARLDLLKVQVEQQMRIAAIERTLGEPL